MTRLVVVLPLEPLVVGARFAFREWPLHITVVQNFASEASVDDVIARLASFDAAAVTVTAAHDEGFGASGSMPVTVIEPSLQLAAMHRSLTALLQPLEFETPDYAGDNYRPHVTHKAHARVHSGDVLTLTQLALVDLTAGRQREVLAVRPLRA